MENFNYLIHQNNIKLSYELYSCQLEGEAGHHSKERFSNCGLMSCFFSDKNNYSSQTYNQDIKSQLKHLTLSVTEITFANLKKKLHRAEKAEKKKTPEKT